MANETDARGVPAFHEEAEDHTPMSTSYKGPALVRWQEADYTRWPHMPEQVKASLDKMNEAANLVQELDATAYGLLADYKAAPKEAATAARDAVAAGDMPASTEDLDKRLDKLARDYRDVVAHRVAVESLLSTRVAEYHAEAERHIVEWRDDVATDLRDRAEPARVALAKALQDARTVYGLAVTVEDMDRPVMLRYERPRVSALRGRELPEAFRITDPVGNVLAGSGDQASFGKDAEAAGRLASMWLRVDGSSKLGRGTIPEALTIPVTDLPPEDMERVAREKHKKDQLARARKMGMSNQQAHVFFGF